MQLSSHTLEAILHTAPLKHATAAIARGQRGSDGSWARCLIWQVQTSYGIGPCLVLLMICSPRFPAYRGLTRATLALIVGAQCPCSHQGRTRRKLRGERSSVSCPSRDHHLGQNRGPLRSPSATESYQRTACRANAAFVTRILPDPRDVSSAGAGQSGKNFHTLLKIRPRPGTLTS